MPILAKLGVANSVAIFIELCRCEFYKLRTKSTRGKSSWEKVPSERLI